MFKGWISILALGVLVACSPSALEQTSTPTLAPAVITETRSPTASPTELILRITLEPTPTDIPVFINESTSPDGRYIAEFIRYGPYEAKDGVYEDVSLFIKPVNGDVRVMLAEITQPAYGLDGVSPQVVLWSVDGKHVYYTNRRGGDGCVSYTNGNDLYKVDVRDGSQEQILPAELREWRVSPDGTRLAYVNLWDTQITILDLTTQVSITIRGNEKPLLRIVWSPDGGRIAITAYENICEERSLNDIIIINTLSSEQKIFAIPEGLTVLSLSARSWLSENQLMLTDPYNKEWILDLIANEFQPMPEGTSQ